MAYLVAGAIMFFGSAIVDVPRRIVSRYVIIAGEEAMNALDDLWQRWYEKLESGLSE